MHLWRRLNRPESRQKWCKNLDAIEKLKLKKVIAGHMLGDKPVTIEAVKFTRKYIENFEAAAKASKNSEDLIGKMKGYLPKDWRR